MAGPPEPLESRLRERRNFSSELRRHGILHSHVRPVASSSAQGLPGQEGLRSHPVGVVGGNISTVHVATRQRSGSRRLNTQHRPRDQSLRQRRKIFCGKAFQAVPVDEELNGLFAIRPARHTFSCLPSGNRSYLAVSGTKRTSTPTSGARQAIRNRYGIVSRLSCLSLPEASLG